MSTTMQPAQTLNHLFHFPNRNLSGLLAHPVPSSKSAPQQLIWETTTRPTKLPLKWRQFRPSLTALEWFRLQCRFGTRLRTTVRSPACTTVILQTSVPRQTQRLVWQSKGHSFQTRSIPYLSLIKTWLQINVLVKSWRSHALDLEIPYIKKYGKASSSPSLTMKELKRLQQNLAQEIL